ncbi:MAG: SDR family NAD(P)-dependent oxidoreductase [Candidatus Polarisedimenticolia bacterium]
MSGDGPDGLEIAIIGMAGRFPGAASVEALWANLRGGVESIRDLTEQELRDAGVSVAELSDPRYVRRAADLGDVSLFDAGLFGFTPREAELTDPQFRVFLEDAWTALEDAGHLGDRHGLRVGVFAGASPGSYLPDGSARAARIAGGFPTALGNERDYLATQVSYRLDLRGPSVLVQTACSTSLVAVHLACQSLIGLECDVALAGGVSISIPQTSGYLYDEGGIVSPDGRCRAFDASAAGCIKGNGSGVVVLRRLADALRDGDSIRAVIRGSAVNNDGSLKVGFTAPSVEGQSDVIAEALAVAGVDPAGVSYVEAHGTGTPLGDPIEVAALTRAFGAAGRGTRCALGSLKSNIGHLDAAAGVAGLIKTVLSLQKGEIPPSLHVDQPNPVIDFTRTPFFVNTRLLPWERNGAPRRAGVSSFGIGGTNAHLVLEEAPAPAPIPASVGHTSQLLVLSAATEPALAALSEALAARLDAADPDDLARATWTLQTGRRRLAWRRSVVTGAAGAAAALRSASPSRAPRRDERRGTQVAFLFPGQGAQHAGMGQALHRDEPIYREAFDRCAAILAPVLDLDLKAVDDLRLTDTRLAQPALFAVSWALARLWMARGIRPCAMAGHSVGEYVAACLAGVMTLEDALGLVAERGRMMSLLPEGAMLAVALSEAELAARLADGTRVSIAAVNGPAACVASGPPADIARLESELASSDVACRRLRTSHAFHSSMMDPILDRYEARVRAVPLAPPSIPFLSNLTGTWITSDQATDPGYWARHVRMPVRFGDQVSAIAADPSRVLLEVGPGTTLATLVRSQVPREMTALSSLPHPKAAQDERTALLEAAGGLWCAGADLDWAAFHEEGTRRRVALPTYPFQRDSYWVDPHGGEPASTPDGSGKNPDIAEWFYVPGWKRSGGRPQPDSVEPPWLILDDGSPLGDALAGLASARGARVVKVVADDTYARPELDRFLLDPGRRDHIETLARTLESEGIAPGRIVHLWCASAGTDPGAALDLGFHAMLTLFQALIAPAGAPGVRVVCVTQGLFDVAGEAVRCPERATMAGICRVAPLEIPGLCCRLVDLDGNDPAAGAGRVLRELDAAAHEPVAAWRGGHRWVPSHESARLAPPASDPAAIPTGGVFVLTGGTGPLELALARRLAGAGARGIVFLESGPDAEAPVAEVRDSGTDVLCFPVAADDPENMPTVMREVRSRFGRLDTVLHTAGSIGGGMIHLKQHDAAERVLSPRVRGARMLAGQLGDGEHLILFSSAISATGVFGQVDYCAASSFLDAFAHASRSAGGPRVVAVDWGMALWDRWQEVSGPGGAALLDQLRDIQRSIGITVEEGVDAMWRAISWGEPQMVVCTQDLEMLVAQTASSSVTDFLSQARPSVRSAQEGAAGIEAAASDTERKVADAWTALLGVSPIGRSDNFFELGGNSLLAIQLASQLRRAFGIELPIARLFEATDLAAQAAAVDQAIEERRSAEEVARLLDEIERLSAQEVRAELERATGAEVVD